MRLALTVARHFGVSRRKAGGLIKEGKVSLFGRVECRPWLDIQEDQILGLKVGYESVMPIEPAHEYIVFNKPKGIICSHVSNPGTPNIYSLLPRNIPKKMFSIGRLDKNSTGLIIITNDGDICQRISHPSFEIMKEYIVTSSKPITINHVNKLKKGLYIGLNTFVKPVSVKKNNKWELVIQIKEGKKHEIRRLLKAIDLKVKHLHRSKIGDLSLGNILLGKYKFFSHSMLTRSVFV